MFSHSTIERGIFVTDFLQALLPRGRQIDVVVASDLGAYPALWVGAYADIVKSIVLLDAFTPNPPRLTKPLSLLTFMSKLYEMRVHFPLAYPYLAYAMRRVFGSLSIKEASAHARAIAFADSRLLDGGLTTLEMRGTPSVVYASKDNKFVEMKEATELMRRLGIEDRYIEDLERVASREIEDTTLDFSPSLSELSESSPSTSSSSNLTSSSANLSPADIPLNDPIFERTLTHSCARLFEPREQDEFGKYNRRHAKADWYHLSRPIAKDIIQLAKRVNAG